MGRSQETFGKKEVRIKKEKKRKDKEQKRALRRSEVKKSSFDDMIAYVDEFGMITSSPPDPGKKTEILGGKTSNSIQQKQNEAATDLLRKGKSRSSMSQKDMDYTGHGIRSESIRSLSIICMEPLKKTML
jgi:S-adenosylmethionine hydrolase